MTSANRLTRRAHRVPTIAVAVVAVAAVALAAACSGGSSGGGSKAAAEKTLGPTHVATGAPLKIGYVYDGSSAGIDNTSNLQAAQAAVKYVNNYLNGVAGRPLSLDVCSTNQTPAGAKTCVSQFVTDGVPIVLNGVTGQAASLFAPLAKQGVPVFVDGSGDPASFSQPGIDILINGLVGLIGAPAALAKEAGVKLAAIAVINVPAAVGAIKSAAPLFYGEYGVQTDIVAIPPGTPDASPQIDAALSRHPGQFMVVGDTNLCQTVMKALGNAAFQGQQVAYSGCITPESSKQLTNVAGTYVYPGQIDTGDSRTVAVYNAAMDLYAPSGYDHAGASMADYQAVVGFVEATEGLHGQVTKASIQQAIHSMPPKPMPLMPGVTFQCNKKQFPIAKNICSIDVLQARLDASGSPTNYEVFSGKTLLTGKV
ncbi:MAG TPA: ABC transporter substrate-binding protein [Mycobacteriales bacterium]|nr:ABC transporter substrate-binding protein [Mycobacteriales bacterium]